MNSIVLGVVGFFVELIIVLGLVISNFKVQYVIEDVVFYNVFQIIFNFIGV